MKQVGIANTGIKTPPIKMHMLDARGTSISGFEHSSVTNTTIPMADRAYAGGKSPMKKEISPQTEILVAIP